MSKIIGVTVGTPLNPKMFGNGGGETVTVKINDDGGVTITTGGVEK